MILQRHKNGTFFALDHDRMFDNVLREDLLQEALTPAAETGSSYERPEILGNARFTLFAFKQSDPFWQAMLS